MKSPLLFFIRFFLKQRPWWLAGGVATLLFSWLASLALLGVSGWFITAAGIAGAAVLVGSAITFNFFYPAGLVRGAAMARTAMRYLDRLVSHEATLRLLADLRVWLFKRMLFQPMQQLGKLRQGDLLNRLTSDIDALDNLYLRVIAPLIAILLLAGVIVLASWLMPPLLLPALMMIVLVGFVLPLWIQSKASGVASQLPQLNTQLRIHLLDGIQGMAELKSFQQLTSQQQKIADADSARYQLSNSQVRLEGLAALLASSITGAALCGLLYLGIPQVVETASDVAFYEFFTAPLLVSAVFILIGLSEALQPMAAAFRQLVETAQSARRLLAIKPAETSEASQNISLDLQQVPEITFQNIDFSWPQLTVLKQFNETIAAGEKVVFSGASGCGKSSLAKMLAGELTPDQGTLLINGHPLADYPEQQRHQLIGYLPQRTQLLNDTLANNLRLGSFGQSISDQQLWQVLDLVGLKTVVEALPDQLNCWLGESGANLSGGQARRLALAAVLLSKPKVLLLDEPFEGLDDQIALQIGQYLLQLEASVLLISHRQQDLQLAMRVREFSDEHVTDK